MVAVVDAQTGADVAPVGPEVTAQVRVTAPVKPPDGVTVMVEAAEAPGLEMATGVEEMAMDGMTAALTVTGTVVEAAILPVAASTPLTVSE